MGIEAGDWVVLTDAVGREFDAQALTGVIPTGKGRQESVVYIKHSLSNGDHNKIPWPATRVRPR